MDPISPLTDLLRFLTTEAERVVAEKNSLLRKLSGNSTPHRQVLSNSKKNIHEMLL
jgi:hypothetical protein